MNAMRARKAFVATVGTLVLGLTATPTSALVSGAQSLPAATAVLLDECPPVGTGSGVVLRPGFHLWCLAVGDQAGVHRLGRLVTLALLTHDFGLHGGRVASAFRTRLIGTVMVVHEKVGAGHGRHESSSGTSTVTAVNTAVLGQAAAFGHAGDVRRQTVHAVNTAPLGTAVAVGRADDVDHQTVTAHNSGILGTAIAVGGGAHPPGGNGSPGASPVLLGL